MMIVFGTGAALGGPVSGWIADVTNWRWSFVFQVRLESQALDGPC